MGLFDVFKGLGKGGKNAESKRIEALRKMMPQTETEETVAVSAPIRDTAAQTPPPVPQPTAAAQETAEDGTGTFDHSQFAMPRLDLEQLSGLRAQRTEPETAPAPDISAAKMPVLDIDAPRERPVKQPETEPEPESAMPRLDFPAAPSSSSSEVDLFDFMLPIDGADLTPEPPAAAPAEPAQSAEEPINVRFFDLGVPDKPEPPAPKQTAEEKPKEKKVGRFGSLFRKNTQPKVTETKPAEPEPPAPEPESEPETDAAPTEPAVDTRSNMERLADQIQARYPLGIRSLYALQSDMQFCVEISRVIRNQKDREELKGLLRERKLLQTEQGEQGETDGVTEVTAELFEQFMNRLTEENQGMLFSYTQVADNAFFRKTLPLYENFCQETYQQPLEDYLIVRRKLAADKARLESLGLLPDYVFRAPADTELEEWIRSKGLPFEAEESADGKRRNFHRIVRVVETEKGNNCYACLKLRAFESVNLLREPEGRVAVYNCDNELCGYLEQEDQQWVSTAMEYDKITMPMPVVAEHVFLSDQGKLRRKMSLALYFSVSFEARQFVLYAQTHFEGPKYFAPAPKEPQRSPEGYYALNLDNPPEQLELNTRRVEGTSLRSIDDLSDWSYTLRPEGTVILKGYSGAEARLTLPSSIDGYPVTEIAKDAFSGNATLIGVRIPGSITLIRENAFRNCPHLASVTIGEGCEQMERNAFSGCPELTKVVSPASLCTLADSTPFSGTPWRDETNDEFLLLGGVLLSWQGKKPIMRIPGGVRVFGRGAAFGYPELREIVFPEGMYAISEQAFYPGNKRLEKITVPLSVRRVGENAFRGTKWLTDHTDDALMINDLLLRYRGAETTLHLSPDVHVICDAAFQGCGIERLWMEDSLTDICDNAFKQCEKLRTVSVGNGLRIVGDSAFALCRNLTDFYLPERIESIGEKAFYGCAMLSEVQFPPRVIPQGKDAFVGTPHILKYGSFAVSAGKLVKYMGKDANVRIPEGVIEIAPRCFAGLRNLVTVVLPRSLKRIDREAFADCVCLFEVQGGDGVSEIETGAFRNCSSLRKFPFQSALRVIGERAFLDTDLQDIILPKDLEWLGAGAFGGRSELTVSDQIDALPVNGAKGSLCSALLRTRNGERLYDRDTTVFEPIRITVKSALSGSVKYSFSFDGRNESRAYREYILSCFGRKAEMTWAEFDRIFMKIRNPATRLRSACDRLKGTPTPEEDQKAFYQRYLRGALLIPESFALVSDAVMAQDDKNMLTLLTKLGAVTEENREALRQMAAERGAVKCEKMLTKS